MTRNKNFEVSYFLLIISFFCFVQYPLLSKERFMPERSVVTDPSLSRRCEVLLKRRKEAREKKDWHLSDKLRDELKQKLMPRTHLGPHYYQSSLLLSTICACNI